MRHAFIVTFLLAAAGGLHAPDAWSDDRVAGLVLDVTGSTEPSLSPYSELSDRTTITLGPDAHVVFVHYGTCRVVTVSGGRLYVDKARYSLAGGKVEQEDKTNCPREQQMASSAPGAGETGAAALVMRGAAAPLELSDHPAIIMIGAHAGDIVSAVLRRGEREVGPMTVNGRSVAWPKDQAALQPGDGYVLVLSDAKRAKAVTLTFSIVASSGVGERPTVLRLD